MPKALQILFRPVSGLCRLLAGIPALMGIDISGSLKTKIPLVGVGEPQDIIHGIYGGLARKALNSMNAIEREDYLRSLENAPYFLNRFTGKSCLIR